MEHLCLVFFQVGAQGRSCLRRSLLEPSRAGLLLSRPPPIRSMLTPHHFLLVQMSMPAADIS
eukprot:3221789-Pleurochrysis_carterae.AAC.3